MPTQLSVSPLDTTLPCSLPRNTHPHRITSRLETKRKTLAKAELAAQVKEDLKTVALGTSKINYMDPRISIAWCKRNEVGWMRTRGRALAGPTRGRPAGCQL